RRSRASRSGQRSRSHLQSFRREAVAVDGGIEHSASCIGRMNKENFEIRLGDLPESAREAVRRETKHYSVPLVINQIPLGSGTLVEIDGHHAVLTAEHVVRHPKRRDLWLTETSHKGPKRLIPPMD